MTQDPSPPVPPEEVRRWRAAFVEQLRREPELLDARTSAAPEVDPPEAGLRPEAVEAIWDAVRRLYASGLSPAITLCLRRRGRVVIDRAIGHASGAGPGDPPGLPVLATPETPFTTFSTSKAITAMLIHLLDERGLLHLDDPVVEYIPEFGRHGKRWITIRHVLTHRSGIPALPGRKVDLALLQDPQRIVELLCEARPVSRAGRRLAYHALSGGFVLGEIVRRVTGEDLRALLGSVIREPLGFRTFDYGVPPERVGEVARNYPTGSQVVFPLSWVVRRALGVGFEEAVALSNTPGFLTALIPSGNLVTTAHELSRFFELLLRNGELDGVQVFEGRTIRRARVEQAYLELDLTLGLPVRYGLGLMLGSRHLSPFGLQAPKAFGHVGFTTVFGYADPERDIAVGLMTNGKPLLTPSLWRVGAVLQAIVRHCG